MEFIIDSSGRGHKYTPEEIQVVCDAMQNAATLTQGAYRNTFEKKFSEYIQMPHSFAVCNATAALELTAQLLQFEKGDELIAPSHTFTSSCYPFIKKGATLVWADIDFDTRVVSAATIEKHITPKTKAILVVHLYGYMADMPAIMQMAKKHNLIVIEDVAQALGTSINGAKAGSFGDFTIHSFHSHKNLTTLGEGGMLCVKEKMYADLIPMLRHNGHTTFAYERKNYWLPAMGELELPELNGKTLWPNNYCLGEVECALGAKLLDRLDQMNTEKRQKAIWFIDELKPYEHLISFQKENSVRHNYHLLAAYVKNGKRNEFMAKMAYDKKIKCDVRYYPLDRYPLYKKAGFGSANCPNADNFFDNQVCFPFEHWRSDEDFNYILKSTKEVLATL